MDEHHRADLMPRDLRYCRTHAFAASLFAAHPWHRSNAAIWAYVAHAWTDLADIKERAKPNVTTDRQP